ncbi:restriction endonuclease subunit S [Candidatus Kirkpatrickella diaphorinae]|uniref:Restriction endonuclease subunit S n=1 Tax=Candidatus Kirkpatrickella diaphorinae TaxID=2984322 RepID=A0ABY6GIU3_9PROT|nr:restriction endonuclease subunit S [Candidatus Kirkpatrickella diaphorinae]UYH51234.1 restriction endonuclease subunit S [Candidatus Kirkpatrickella diaphorinae]
MRLPAYPEYRESGVAWLGKVPAHWTIDRLKTIFCIVGGSTPKSDEPSYWNGEIVWISPADLSSLTSLFVFRSIRRITRLGLESCAASLVPAGSIVLSTRAPIGYLAISTIELCTNQGCKALVPKQNDLSLYFAYYLSICTKSLNLYGKGTTFSEISGDALGAFHTPYPSKFEQTAIAAFLDRETGKIDALIAAQEKLLALLAEKRQATISHAVTRGLNPDAPMKDFGIAWLGKVPAHWEVNPIKSVATINDNVLPESTNPSCHINYIDIGSVSLEGGIRKIDTFQFADAPSRARRLVKQGDVIVSTVRTYLKAITSISSDFANFVVSTGFAVIRPTIDLQKEFAKFCLQSDYFIDEVICRSTGVSYPAITATDLGKLSLPFPSREEQTAIATFLDKETGKIDALVAAQKKLSELLKERRSALIAAAVTGKIDVRNALSEEQAA